MKFQRLDIPAIILITPDRHQDKRGFFSETYRRDIWQEGGVNGNFVQDNHSLSVEKFVIRGLHFQSPPKAQGKLVRVSRGSILDVAVDIRHGSPSFGQHVSAILDAKTGQQLWVPAGFAHGFCTLEPDTEVQYKVTNHYAPECDAGIKWNDPALGINWNIPEDKAAIVSEKDQSAVCLAELDVVFPYEKFK